MEKVLPESVPTRHLSGPLSLHELQRLFEQAPFGIGGSIRVQVSRRQRTALPNERPPQADHVGKTLFDIVPAQAPCWPPLLPATARMAPPMHIWVDEWSATHPAAPPARWRLSVQPGAG